MMNTLQTTCGHENLRLGFASYITLIGEGDKRLTDLADILGISRQACNQAVKQIEAAGYIERTADPLDGRAKQLTLSGKGTALRQDGVRVVAEWDKQFTNIVGTVAMADTSKSLRKLYGQLGLDLHVPGETQTLDLILAGLLPRLADYTLQRLMELTREQGHPGLKLSFGQVLTLIGPSGGRIQQIASIQDVSKQAISVIATELEELGYLQHHTDPVDARQIVLRLTERGDQLIADSVRGVEALEAEFATLIGRAAMRRLCSTMNELYLGLFLEQDVFEYGGSVDINLLARQLLQQLGENGCQALARLLLNPTENKR